MNNLSDIYKAYQKQERDPVSKKDFMKMNYEFNLFAMKKVMEGHEVYLPGRVGSLIIKGKKEKIVLDEEGKPKRMSINWKETKLLRDRNPEAKEKKKVVYNTNEHSDGVRYRFWWRKDLGLVNADYYSLRIARCRKREASALIKQGKTYRLIHEP